MTVGCSNGRRQCQAPPRDDSWAVRLLDAVGRGATALVFGRCVGAKRVGDKKHKAECKTGTLTGGSCWAYSVNAAQGRLPEEVGTAWWVLHIGKQQLRVLPGEEAEVVIAEVYV